MTGPDTPPAADTTARAMIIASALVALLAAQIGLYSIPESAGWGAPLNLGAAVLLTWGLLGRPPRWLTMMVVRARLSPRAVLIGLAVCLAIGAAVTAAIYELIDRKDYAPVFILWFGCMAAYLAAFARPGPLDWRGWWRTYRRDVAVVAALTAFGALLRLAQLGQIPRVINGDEGVIGQFATLAHLGPLANPYSLFENIGGLYMQVIGLSLQIFGQTPFALRLAPALGGIGAIPALYLLSRYLFGRRVAFMAAVLLTVSHVHIHFSRTVAVTYIHSTWLMPLEMYFFISGLEKCSAWRMAAAAAIVAVHFSVYLGAQIIMPLFLIYLIIAAIVARPIDPARSDRRAFWRSALRPVSASAFGLIVMILPQLSYNVRHPDQFFLRLNSGGTFQSGWLISEAARTGLTEWQLLLDRVAHVFLSLTYYPSLDFYGVSVPVLTTLVGALFTIGLIVALWRTRQHRYLLLNGYFWGLVVAVGVFSIPPSADTYRILIALPAALILAAIGLNELLLWLEATLPQRQAVIPIVAGGALLVAGWTNLSVYYLDFAQQCRYGAVNTRFASYLGTYLGTLKPDTSAHLLNTDYLRYGTHMSVDFLSRGIKVTNVPGPASELQPAPNMAIIATPERADELRQWARVNPGGILHAEHDCGRLILLAYYLPWGD